jgi:hypothetical protein
MTTPTPATGITDLDFTPECIGTTAGTHCGRDATSAGIRVHADGTPYGGSVACDLHRVATTHPSWRGRLCDHGCMTFWRWTALGRMT